MNKRSYKIISIILLAAGFFVLVLTVVLPGITTALISLKNYKAAYGLSGSAWAGTRYYTQFFSSSAFSGLFVNSLVLSLLPSVLSALIAIPFALSVGKMKAGMLRSGVTAALLLPAFIPNIVLADFWMILLSPTTSPLGLKESVINNPELFRLAYILLAAIKPLAVCAFSGACAAATFIGKGQSPLRGAVTGILIAQAASLAAFLSTDQEQLLLLSNSMNLSSSETLDALIYRRGILGGYFSFASAGWAFKTGLHCAAAVVLAAFIAKRVKSDTLASKPGSSVNASAAGLLSGLLAALAFALCVAGPLILRLGGIAGPSLTESASVSFSGATMNSLRITVGATLLFAILITVFTVGLSSNFNTWTVMLILLLSAMANNTLGEFLVYFRIYSLNTNYPAILSIASNLSFVLAAGYLARIRKPDSGAPLGALLSCLPYVAAFCGVIAANAWGSYFYQMIYTRPQSDYGIALLLKQALMQPEAADGNVSFGLLLRVVIPAAAIAVGTSVVFAFADRYTARQEMR